MSYTDLASLTPSRLRFTTSLKGRVRKIKGHFTLRTDSHLSPESFVLYLHVFLVLHLERILSPLRTPTLYTVKPPLPVNSHCVDYKLHWTSNRRTRGGPTSRGPPQTRLRVSPSTPLPRTGVLPLSGRFNTNRLPWKVQRPVPSFPHT